MRCELPPARSRPPRLGDVTRSVLWLGSAATIGIFLIGINVAPLRETLPALAVALFSSAWAPHAADARRAFAGIAGVLIFAGGTLLFRSRSRGQRSL